MLSIDMSTACRRRGDSPTDRPELRQRQGQEQDSYARIQRQTAKDGALLTRARDRSGSTSGSGGLCSVGGVYSRPAEREAGQGRAGQCVVM